MIIHVDMDAFYASVEERENPSLKGRPLVVAGSPDARGVVSAANYAAREFGVHSAMPTSVALRRCRDLVVLPVRMSFYSDVSQQIRGIFERYTPVVEPLSLDEAFLDPGGGERLYGDAVTTARRIRNDIHRELGLVASVGVASNKFLAKLASDHEKPDGFTVVEADAVQEFLDPMPVERIWGVGPATKQRLYRSGIHTVRELRARSQEELARSLGKHGAQLWNLAHGIDPRKVNPEHETKSISHETTFAKDIDDQQMLDCILMQLTESVCLRLRRGGLKARTVTLKLRDPEFRTKTFSRTLPVLTDATSVVWNLAHEMLCQNRDKDTRHVRLIGLGVSHLGDTKRSVQVEMFDGSGRNRDNHADRVADQIRTRFGDDAIGRARSVNRVDSRTDK